MAHTIEAEYMCETVDPLASAEQYFSFVTIQLSRVVYENSNLGFSTKEQSSTIFL
jgi:hypothetical protein